MRGLRPKLSSACRERTLVTFRSRYESHRFEGYIVAVGKEWFLALEVHSAAFFYGFRAARYEELTEFLPALHPEFIETALQKRKARAPKIPEIDLEDLASLLIGAGHQFPVVSIHCEAVAPDVCHIGKVVAVSPSTLSLQEICPDATWEKTIGDYPLAEITRVDFGGPYEESLVLVGGPASAAAHGAGA
jgi:hypothetical protein